MRSRGRGRPPRGPQRAPPEGRTSFSGGADCCRTPLQAGRAKGARVMAGLLFQFSFRLASCTRGCPWGCVAVGEAVHSQPVFQHSKAHRLSCHLLQKQKTIKKLTEGAGPQEEAGERVRDAAPPEPLRVLAIGVAGAEERRAAAGSRGGSASGVRQGIVPQHRLAAGAGGAHWVWIPTRPCKATAAAAGSSGGTALEEAAARWRRSSTRPAADTQARPLGRAHLCHHSPDAPV